MTVPNNVYLLRDPSLPNPTWDHMFNTGLIDANGSYASETCSPASSRRSRSSRPTPCAPRRSTTPTCAICGGVNTT